MNEVKGSGFERICFINLVGHRLNEANGLGAHRADEEANGSARVLHGA